jgi:hypothetical protein
MKRKGQFKWDLGIMLRQYSTWVMSMGPVLLLGWAEMPADIKADLLTIAPWAPKVIAGMWLVIYLWSKRVPQPELPRVGTAPPSPKEPPQV